MENISSNASIILLAAAFICMPVTAATQYGRELKRFTSNAHVKGSGNLFQIGHVYRAANSFREKDKSDNNEDMNKGENENQNNEAIHRIIDISEYQNGADLEAAYRDGISGFILRIGCGNDDVCQDDMAFKDFVSQAERIGAPWGVYIFSYATCDADVQSEISHVIRVIGDRNPRLGVWWDIENSEYKEQIRFNDFKHAESIRQWAGEFISAMQDRGLIAGVYCNLNYASNIDFSDIEHIWIAQYNDNPDFDNPPYKCDIWQYSSKTCVAGFSGNVDINAVYADWINDILNADAGERRVQ